MQKLPHSVARRFWRKAIRAKLIPTEDPGKIPCLLWTGAKDNKGYGVFKAFPGCMGLPSGIVRVHRLAFWIQKGPFPRNMQVDHICREKSCLEITHLQLLGISEHARKSNIDRYTEEAILDDIQDDDIIF